MGDEYNKIVDILVKNQKKKFVQRILHKDRYPVLENERSESNPEGAPSTHSMSYSDDGQGRYFVYPTVIEDGSGGLKRLSGEEADAYAQESGEFIEFDNREEADWFSKKYKTIWDK